ncbi:MAG TPA: DUF4167 domain-containing protein [Phenylobacterium sp.]|nr:DUF4167 domain-containing protein [Phenylobacterium sp.]HEX4713221.1 DUF4167 domain-containing protein [Phenylobacterium sp.]
MRDFKGMKRQRGRNRGGGGSGGGGGGKPQAQNANRAFDSNGPEGTKVRGNAQHVFEKYQQLARDASAAGDRVLGENYLQHAEHYFRLLRAMQPTRPASEILGRDHFSSGFDIDFEDEGAQAQSEAADAASAEAGETPETWQAREGGGERPRDDGRPRDGQRDGQVQRDERPRDDRPRDDRPRYENRDRDGGGRDGPNRDGQARRDRPWRDERPRDDRPRDERPRDDRPREDRPRDDRPRYERDDRPRFDRNRDDRPERDPLAVVEPQAQPPLASTSVEPAPERKTRVLRDSEGGESHAPAFLQAPAARADVEEAPPRPRRRRTPRVDAPASSGTEEA